MSVPCTTALVQLQRECLIRWKQSGIRFSQTDFLLLVEENHAFNYQLWHAEDRARRDDQGFEFVYRAKREIDHYNQQRNNRMEAIDDWLMKALHPLSPTHCPVHSETPGMMIDRLSILALKTYHMAEQLKRTDTDATHHATCTNQLLILETQQNQLQTCLSDLLEEVYQKRKTFQTYRQCKMYNDPTLNPELYQQL